MLTSRQSALTGIAVALLLTAVAGCSAPPPQAGSVASAAPQPEAVVLTSNVRDGATKVRVDTLVSAKAAAGTLSKVTLTYAYINQPGEAKKGVVTGRVNKDQTGWAALERLEPSATYRLTMVGQNRSRQATTTTTSFQTSQLTLSDQTFPSLYPLPGSLVGIGMPVVINFDVAVENRREFEKHLHVTSTPAQPGTWHWYSGREVRFRPKTFWRPGTKVSVNADINGLSAGGGVYGQASAQTSFTVGRSLIVKVNLATDIARVYQNGQQVRTIYVSGGKPGWQTRSGTKLIMDKESNKKMTNEMIGAKEDYSLVAQYALRITNSGEFLHSAPWNTPNFGRRNASHGCIGMSNGDAGWLFERTLVGDPVVTTGSSKGMELGNGYGDWNASFQEYRAGSV